MSTPTCQWNTSKDNNVLGYIYNLNVNNNKFSVSSTVEPRYNDMPREQYKLYRYMEESLYRNSRFNDMAVKLQKNRYIE